MILFNYREPWRKSQEIATLAQIITALKLLVAPWPCTYLLINTNGTVTDTGGSPHLVTPHLLVAEFQSVWRQCPHRHALSNFHILHRVKRRRITVFWALILPLDSSRHKKPPARTPVSAHTGEETSNTRKSSCG